MLRSLLCVCLVLAGCAGTKQNTTYNKPIHVSCEGRTFESAKQVCFSNAIEFAVGAVVVTEAEVRKSKLVKDDILKHSSGYVEDYKIEGRIDEPNRVLLIMDVTVKHSSIAERIMNAQNAYGEIEGPKLGAQYSTFIKNKQTGDNLLSKVLSDYPKHAFNIEKGEVKYQLNVNREPIVVVPYKVTWNYKYIQALNEALSLTSDKKTNDVKQERIMISAKDPNAWVLGSTDVYYFNDKYRFQMITQSLVSKLYIVVTFLDKNGKTVLSGCDGGRDISGPYVTEPFKIDGNLVIDASMYVTFHKNQHKIESINEVKVSFDSKPCIFVD